MNDVKQNLNLQRYHNVIGFTDASLKNMRKYTRFPLGRYVWRFKEKVKCFIICGFKQKGHFNDNYHLFSKLCRYKTWDDVKINLWDRIRFRIITGYRFEK
jgi:hypothetical protein